ncbi:hypothetical protein FNV43_RR00437 [Rhamnella rubrinervis]|uniref:Large ribosomal subunit protein uL2 RNA-binding domain-containing protein n=1 Tax=Rhamnella rubrinervis TaxID=2594499 RepID=A0A8K0MSE3_9ROSA|nr:hypothetical protein FNV43_RR00437 [Rhamnella rubrinervis]
MAIHLYKTSTPSTCNGAVDSQVKSNLQNNLIYEQHRCGKGRNARGIIIEGHREGGHKRLYRKIDFRQNEKDMYCRIVTIEYDPNQNAYICLIHYGDGPTVIMRKISAYTRKAIDNRKFDESVQNTREEKAVINAKKRHLSPNSEGFELRFPDEWGKDQSRSYELYRCFFIAKLPEAYAFLNPIVDVMPVIPLLFFLLAFVWQATALLEFPTMSSFGILSIPHRIRDQFGKKNNKVSTKMESGTKNSYNGLAIRRFSPLSHLFPNRKGRKWKQNS